MLLLCYLDQTINIAGRGSPNLPKYKLEFTPKQNFLQPPLGGHSSAQQIQCYSSQKFSSIFMKPEKLQGESIKGRGQYNRAVSWMSIQEDTFCKIFCAKTCQELLSIPIWCFSNIWHVIKVKSDLTPQCITSNFIPFLSTLLQSFIICLLNKFSYCHDNAFMCLYVCFSVCLLVCLLTLEKSCCLQAL